MRVTGSPVKSRKRVIVRFAGDSGDGMQLAGSRFTEATAVLGNDLVTLPDFPAEIRAPAGTLHGVSAFQIHFASRDILTPGDHPNVLVAMNPAALKTNLGALEKGGTIIANEDAFTDNNLRKAGYAANPLEDGSLDDYQLFRVPMTTMTVRATEGIEGIMPKDAQRTKNVFALGLLSWMYGRPVEVSIDWIEKKFAGKPGIRDANIAAFRGSLGVTASSGPGVDLKAETIGLAVTLELPMVIVDVQRAGPSTGMPTKTEQGDLLLAMYGRHGESPLPIVAAYTPGQCFDAAIEAVRIAVKYRTPVILLSDTFLANSSEPWQIPDVSKLPEIDPNFATDPNGFQPYKRDRNLARPWAVPGTPGLRHRIGGLEKEDVTGNISYEPENHEHMTRLRAERVQLIADDLPELEVDDPDGDATLLVLGWGSSYGAIQGAARRVRREQGLKVAPAHIRHLQPLP